MKDIEEMMPMEKRASWDRIPVIINFEEKSAFTETYGFSGSQGRVWLEAQLFRPREKGSRTLLIFMHPSSSLQLLPLPIAMADAGFHVLCASSRYVKNDSALIMEKVCYDLGQYVKWARDEGYEKVVLVGWSGGGVLSLFYQSQAENPTITHTPAGDRYDLTAAGLLPVDGIVFIAAHLSRAETLTELLDPSVVDELDPDKRDIEFDIYDVNCPNQPPFTADFVARFREAQRARSLKITTWAENMLAYLRKKADGELERAFVVPRTWCDVRFLDLSLDPNERKPNMTIFGEPRIVNSAPSGLARYSSIRSWLSQWSIDRSQATGRTTAPYIKRIPVLQVENGADDGVPATHNPAIHQMLGTRDKEYVTISGANHYYVGQPQQLKECVEKIKDWTDRKSLAG